MLGGPTSVVGPAAPTKELKFIVAGAKTCNLSEVSIVKCHTCADIADKAFESSPDKLPEISSSFLVHVVESHPGELLNLLAERYGPIFLAKREMR